ncbi:hypothetical protein ACFQHW_01250 [Lapidilactobacillus achengensis]|uniref:Uncharacterized protein n=1 Tax=Lapidilactobacillus achengensis TaxID=2486000 RepID=A0ABW1UMR3_9LACO|nr:hypothetical protein [Lapidilactobacillus achengensis]
MATRRFSSVCAEAGVFVYLVISAGGFSDDVKAATGALAAIVVRRIGGSGVSVLVAPSDRGAGVSMILAPNGSSLTDYGRGFGGGHERRFKYEFQSEGKNESGNDD